MCQGAMMASDARVRYTKMVIKATFVELLRTKPVSRITVTELCERAEISRATFYKHYDDCFALLRDIEDELIAELDLLVRNSPRGNPAAVFAAIIAKVQEDGEVYVTLASANGDPAFPNKILELYYQVVSEDLSGSVWSGEQHHLKWLYYFLASGSSGVLRLWMSTGMTEDPDDLSEFIGELTQTALAAWRTRPRIDHEQAAVRHDAARRRAGDP